ncbi:MAG: thioesterase family protein [Candidatus Methylomirabilales bacterium]
MERLKIGLVYEDWMVVEPGQTASLLIPGLPEVLSSASLVTFIQLAAAKVVAPYLKPGQSTVGTKINLEQFASTPVGMEVKAKLRIDRLESRRIGFVVEVSDDFEKICHGSHERYIIDIDWLRKKVEDKLRLQKGD